MSAMLSQGLRFCAACRTPKTVLVAILGASVGWMAWIPPAHFASLWVLPMVWGLLGRWRLRAVMMVAYYLTASFLVEPSMASYFPGASITAPLVWLGCALLLALPYALAARWLPSGIDWLAAAIMSAVPPLGAIGLCSPLFAATAAFPGWGVGGLLAALALQTLLAASHRPAMTATAALGTAMVVALAVPAAVPAPPNPSSATAGWAALDTSLGRTPASASDWLQRQIVLRDSIAARLERVRPGSVLLTPEDIAGGWTGLSPWAWHSIASKARDRGVTVMLGATLPMPDHHLADGFLLLGSRRGVLTARQPIPIAEWHPSRSGGYSAGWSRWGPAFVGKVPVALLVCYEQLLIWPAAWSWLGHVTPEIILAPGNHGWARSAPAVARLQVDSAKALGRLFGVTVLVADNAPAPP